VSGAYRFEDLVDKWEWSLLGLDALDYCTELAVYGAARREADSPLSVLHMQRARQAGALATLWWMTGWEDMPALEVE